MGAIILKWVAAAGVGALAVALPAFLAQLGASVPVEVGPIGGVIIALLTFVVNYVVSKLPKPGA